MLTIPSGGREPYQDHTKTKNKKQKKWTYPLFINIYGRVTFKIEI